MNDKWFNTMFMAAFAVSLLATLATFGAVGFALYLAYEWLQKM